MLLAIWDHMDHTDLPPAEAGTRLTIFTGFWCDNA